LCGDTLNPGGLRAIAEHLAVDSLLPAARPIAGMVISGPGGVRVRGVYGRGASGHALERAHLDQWLIERAVEQGVSVEQDCAVDEAIVEDGTVVGVRARSNGRSDTHRARMVIGADGRRSRLAFGLGLARHPSRPRRWAIGAYFDGVEGLSDVGEMHVRRGHYIGVAPMPGGLANTCLVVPYDAGSARWQDTAAMLSSRLAADATLRDRFARARMIGPPVVLGPMAVDVSAPGAPGLLLAGDAAGFIDPMTGDGMTFALRGGVLAATVALEVIAGRTSARDAVQLLARRRHEAFRAKWRFNRSLRQLVASPGAVGGAALAARIAPGAFAAIIRYAGDAA
jgi:flavin-dependent dehydrogenase